MTSSLIMSPYDLLLDYEQRSLRHVAGIPEQIDAPGLWRGIGYRIGNQWLASAIVDIAELLTLPTVTPVPGAQAWLLGVANVHGTLLPVVDLKQFLEGERTVLHEHQRALVLKQPGGHVAVLIDELFGQRSFVESQRVPLVPAPQGRYSAFVVDAFQLGERVWRVFDLSVLARTPEFRQASAA